MVSYADQRHVLPQGRTPQRLFREQHASLLVPFEPAGHREIHLIEGQRVFAGGHITRVARHERLVGALRVKPRDAVDSIDEKERLAITFRIERLSNFGRDEHPILFVDRELVFPVKNQVSQRALVPSVLSDRDFLPHASTASSVKFSSPLIFSTSTLTFAERHRAVCQDAQVGREFGHGLWRTLWITCLSTRRACSSARMDVIRRTMTNAQLAREAECS